MEREVERHLASEADYEKALDEIERFFDKEPKPGTPEATRFDALAHAINEYEGRHWPIASKGKVMAKRTTHRSSSGKKLYAVRDKEGKFKDIQTYKRAHSSDIKRKSAAEKAKKK